jgi:putative ABC transport system ATP-binding protein
MDKTMLTTTELTLGYQDKAILKLPPLHIADGNHYLLTGPSGSGKTTLLYSLAGLLEVLSGNIIINNTDITQLSESDRDHFRGQHLGIIFQTLHLVKSLSAIDNLMLASYAANMPQDKKYAQSLLDKLGIGDKANALPAALSQGQAQRVAIARAILHHPALLLADEPTSSLDDASCEAVITLLKSVAREANITLIISTHDNRVKPHFEHIICVGAQP